MPEEAILPERGPRRRARFTPRGGKGMSRAQGVKGKVGAITFRASLIPTRATRR